MSAIYFGSKKFRFQRVYISQSLQLKVILGISSWLSDVCLTIGEGRQKGDLSDFHGRGFAV